MPVTTSVNLLPPTPIRLDISSSSFDGSSDGPSFQDTLQRASAQQDNSPQPADDTSSSDSRSTSKADDGSKTSRSKDAKPAQRAKPKKAKSTAAEPHDETEMAHAEGDARPVEAVKDAGDEGHSAKNSSKQKDTTVTAPVKTVAAGPSVPTAPVAAQQSDDHLKTAGESTAHTAAKQTRTPADVKKASPDTADQAATANNDGTDPSPASQSDAKQPGAAAATKATTNTAADTVVRTKPFHKTQSQNSNAAADPSGSTATTSAAAAAAALGSTAAISDVLAPDAVASTASGAVHSPAVAPIGAAGATAASGAPASLAKGVAATAVDDGAKALATSEAQFADSNHGKIVSAVHGQLLPTGGTMQIRLDPPELGALQVSVQVRNGVMIASFETANADSTRLLSHSLGDLRTALELAGVTVDKIHVQQSSKPDSGSTGGDNPKQGQSEQNPQAKQEQQRRELLQRMWRKLSGGDPLDLTA